MFYILLADPVTVVLPYQKNMNEIIKYLRVGKDDNYILDCLIINFYKRKRSQYKFCYKLISNDFMPLAGSGLTWRAQGLNTGLRKDFIRY